MRRTRKGPPRFVRLFFLRHALPLRSRDAFWCTLRSRLTSCFPCAFHALSCSRKHCLKHPETFFWEKDFEVCPLVFKPECVHALCWRDSKRSLHFFTKILFYLDRRLSAAAAASFVHRTLLCFKVTGFRYAAVPKRILREFQREANN